MATLAAASAPLGLEAIYRTCRRLYPEQPNPLQVAAVLKYWLGGREPLDYISMYANPGDTSRQIPPHWHYVSFGLSDLHGDGRVHELSRLEEPSGFGFELTFRLLREFGEVNPPTWPATMMQSLAKYIFQSKSSLCSGDHVSWHNSLDTSNSSLRHIIVAEDAQLQPISTPFGLLEFLQIVGVTNDELKGAQYWNGPGVLELLRSTPLAGGPWLITDMKRDSVFEIDHRYREHLTDGIVTEGSNLSGVSGHCSWEEYEMYKDSDDDDNSHDVAPHSPNFTPLIFNKDEFMRKVATNASLPTIGERRESLNISPTSDSSRRESLFGGSSSDTVAEIRRTQVIDHLYLKFDKEAGSYLSLALKSRLKHGRHFTFKSVLHTTAITFLPQNVAGSVSDIEHPYAAHGSWLHVMLDDDFIDRLIGDLEELDDLEEITSSRLYTWPDKNISIMIVTHDG